jgi:hypothetical protein
MNPVCIGLEVLVLGARLCFGEPVSGGHAACPSLRLHDRAFQSRLAAELRALPPGTATEAALGEWIALRDQARACRARR